MAYWVSQLRRGATVNRVGTLVYGSDEVYVRAGGTPTAFVRDLYVRILGRQADQDGVAYWVTQVQRRGRGGVASQFFGSIESRRGRVTALYDGILGRTPDDDGRDYWAEQLKKVNDVRLATQLASSPEFFDRAQVGCGSTSVDP